MTKYQQIFHDIKKSSGYTTIGHDVDYKVFAEEEGREVVLQFEESRQIHDWLHNLLFIPCPLFLDGHVVLTTLGYAISYASCRNEPLDRLDDAISLNPGCRVKVQGWSYGSAMAKIAVRHFYIRHKIPVDEELTYGDVLVWLNPFVRWLARKWSVACHEFTCINDLVTWCVPLYHRTRKCMVGSRLNLKSLLNTEYNHTHYEEYDYTKFE